MNSGSQYSTLQQHQYKQVERSKSPMNTQNVPWDNQNRVSPLKYPMYVPNHQPHHKIQTVQQQLPTKHNVSMLEKQNTKHFIENKSNITLDQGFGSDSKINAIDRVIQNCNIMNISSPTKQNHNHNTNASNLQQTNEKRSSTPVHNQTNQSNIQNYQTFHQQYPSQNNSQQYSQMTNSQIHSQAPSHAHSPSQSQITYTHPYNVSTQPLPISTLQHPYVAQGSEHKIQQQILCSNKDGKKAKYARADNPQQAFCSKCSIVLVGMGVKMIDVDTPQNNRQKQLKHFIAEVNNLKNNVAKQINSIQLQKSRVSSNARIQRDDLTKRYSQIINMFKQFQSKDLTLLAEFEQESIKKLSDFENQFRRSWDKLELMVKDISPNIDMIKVHISQQQFKGFMQDYNSQIKSVIGRLDTFNMSYKETKPFNIKKQGLDRYNYESCGQLIKQQKNTIYFSFQRKANEQKQQQIVGNEVPRIQIKSQQSWRKQQQPFRVLFSEDQSRQQIPSPTFKKF